MELLEGRTLFAAAGLVAAYAFDEGAGTSAGDASGTGNVGVLANGPAWNAAGKFGGALSFDGVNDIVNVADSNSLDLTTGMTLEAWVRPSSLSGYRTVVMKDVPGELSYAVYASGDVNRPSAWARTNNASVGINGSAALPLNAWSHVATTYDGATLRVYVNGVQTGSRAVTGSLQVSANPLHVGGNAVWGEYFAGLIDEVRVYNRALPATEIQADMNTAVGVPPAPDTTAPVVALTAPAGGANVSGTVAVSATASDNVGVAGVQFKLDGANLGAEDTSAPYSVSWNANAASLGGHALTAVARDAAGNVTTSTAVDVTVVDATPPTVSVTAPAGGATVSGSVTLNANASDDRSVAGVQFLLNGSPLGAEDASAPYSIVWDTTVFAGGPYTITARARDVGGNTTTSTGVAVTVDNRVDATAPTVSMTSPSDGSSVSGTVAVGATAADDIAVVGVQFLLDGNPLGAEDTTAPYGVSWNANATTPGGHTLSAVARDGAGRSTTSSPIAVSVLDVAAPSVSVTSPSAGAVVSGTVNVTASASDNVAVAGVQFLLDGNPLGAEDTTSPYSAAWDTSTAAAGTHTITARGRDAAGNTATSAAVNVSIGSPVPAGLVAAYSFNEGAGTTAGDSSGNGNVGTLANGPVWNAAGRFGGALSFDGVNDIVNIADSNSLDLTTGMTLEAWVRPSSQAGFRTVVMKDVPGELSYTIYGSGDTNRPSAWARVGSSSVDATGTAALALNAWSHVAATYNGSALFLYVNGTQVATRSVTGAIQTSANPLHVGGNAVWGEYFAGMIDDVRVYNRPLTVSEIQTDMNTAVGTPPAPDTTAPTVSLIAPAPAASVSGAVTVTAAAGDNIGVAGVQFKLNGVNLGAEDTAAPYSVVWDTTASGNGGYQLTAVARDAAGNSTTSTPISVTVSNSTADTTPPSVSLTAPANNATVSGAAVTLSASASDNVGVVGVQFILDGVATGAEDTTSPYSISWDSRTLANGAHTLTARARDAAGNAATSAARTLSVSNTSVDPAVVGQWGPVTPTPIVDMHMALLNNGKILMWDGGPACIGATSATIWDVASNTFTPVPSETAADIRDLFCSAPTVLADGRVLVVGGHECVDTSFIGSAMSNLFDPVTQTWTRGPNMAYRRWYPSVTTLPDGRALVTAGSDVSTISYIPIPEIYNPVTNSFSKLTGANQVIPNYPFMFVLPDGRVLAAGSDESPMATYALNVATQSWSVVDSRSIDAGSAVMYLPGKIMKTGSSYLSPPADNGGGTPSKATTYVMDATQATPTWTQTASMQYPRTHLNLTVLPDGSVVATGGSSDIGGVNTANAVYAAELWSPATQTWATMASAQRARLYHSTATLLPDGRVLVAGSGHNYYNAIEELSSEIFSPAYLFKGARPTVTSAPSTLSYNSNFFVGTPDGASIASVTLIRNGAVTHSFNMDQRYVPLTFQQTTGGLTVQAPADANLAPPGTYMLFIVNSNGVPSVAPFVRLPAGYEDSTAPSAPTNLTATAGTGSASLTWSVSSDNVGVAGYNVYRSASNGFTPSPANLIGQSATTSFNDSGLAAGTYYYVVAARDAAGNISGPSNQANVTLQSDTTAPTVAVTSPAAGTVSGLVTLGASASDNVGVAGVQFLVDGVNSGAEDTTAPYSVSWNTVGVANGAHTITARARDASGNVTLSAPVAVTVSNAAPTGLVAAYNFDEGVGSTLTDGSGNALNGTITGAAWVAGHSGSALSFNGTGNWVTIPDANSLDFTTGMTIEAWLMPRSLTGWEAVVMKERPGGLAYALYSSDDTNKPPAGYVNVGGSDRSAAGAASLTLNTWTHLATTYDGTSLRMYVNGTLVGTTAVSGSIVTSTGVLRIGGNSVWGEYFNGLIDDVRLYNRALTVTQIQSDMIPPPAPAAATSLSLLAAVPVADTTTPTTSKDSASALLTSDTTTAPASPFTTLERLRALRRRRAYLFNMARRVSIP